MVKHEFKDLLASFAETATGGLQVYTIGGSTHPSFSDVFETDATGLNAAFKTMKMKVRLSEIIKGIVLPKLLLAMGC